MYVFLAVMPFYSIIQTVGLIDRQTSRQKDRQTERQTGRWTARQTDFEIFASNV
jgi:hypothetical protein